MACVLVAFVLVLGLVPVVRVSAGPDGGRGAVPDVTRVGTLAAASLEGGSPASPDLGAVPDGGGEGEDPAPASGWDAEPASGQDEGALADEGTGGGESPALDDGGDATGLMAGTPEAEAATARALSVLSGGPVARLLAAAGVDGYYDMPVAYVDEEGRALVHVDTRIIDRNDDYRTTWGEDGMSTWYAATEDITLGSRVTCKGDVHLILVDGTTLASSAGLSIASGASLTVFGQVGQTGELTANLTSGETPAILLPTTSSLVVNGGVVYARGTSAGIGYGAASQSAAIGSVTVNGGTVTAIGGNLAAGIGGGRGAAAARAGGVVTVTGGYVEATGHTGIGGGYGNAGGDGGTVTITGGEVHATGIAGAGIGGSNGNGTTSKGGDGGTVRISGGAVYATSQSSAAAIGGGRAGTSGSAGSITITGGEVHTTNTGGGAAIGGGDNEASGSVAISGGTVTANATVADDGTVTTSGTGAGIQAGTINLDWTDETFSTTEITASSYSSAINLIRPYVVKGRNITATQASSAGVTIVPAEAVPDDPVPYLDASGDEQSCEVYANLSDALAEGYTLAPGWYVVDRDITPAERIVCSGDVHLILKDGKTLDASSGGVRVNTGDSLAVYAQSADEGAMGVLNATGGAGQAGIGGDAGRGGGIVTVNGGSVTARGGEYANVSGGAGIGGGGNASDGRTESIVINGGVVNAYGGSAKGDWGGAGIGGGDNKAGIGSVVISGGNVTAKGGSFAAGIGGGDQGGGGTIVISGGTVVSSCGGEGSAGIGGGWRGNSGNISITGGNVKATSTNYGSGIGSGGRSNAASGIATGGTVSITGGVVEAISTGTAAGIGGGSYGNGTGVAGPSVSITGGNVTAVSASGASIGGGGTNATGTLRLGWKDGDLASGEPTITASRYNINNLVLVDGNTFARVDDGSFTEVSLSMLKGLSAESTIAPHLVAGEGVPYLEYNAATGQMVQASRKPGDYINLSGVSGITTAATTIGTAGATSWYVLDADVTAAARITCAGDVNLILADGATLDARKGIAVTEGNGLSVYAQTTNRSLMGALTAAGENASSNAAIGANNSTDAATPAKSGAIVINGGEITATGASRIEATGNYGAAGIGGGNRGLGFVTINGGYVTATTNGYAAGIGNGYAGGYNDDAFSGGEVVINGGVVHATGSNNGAGIGGGSRGGGADVTITGGDVTAQGSVDAAGIGGGGSGSYSAGDGGSVTITGGTVRASAPGRGAGIGGGGTTATAEGRDAGEGGSISISGGTVVASSGSAAAIGGGVKADGSGGSGGSINIAGGKVAALGTGVIGSGGGDADGILRLKWQDGDAASGLPQIVASGYRIGTLDEASDAFVEASDADFTQVTKQILNAYMSQTTIVPFEPDPNDVPYLDYVDGEMVTKCRTAGTYTELTSATASLGSAGEGGWYVVAADTTVSSRMVCSGDVHLILKNGTELSAAAGITVQDPSALTVYQQPEGAGGETGKLTAKNDFANRHNAVIGGLNGGSTGAVTINGGAVSALPYDGTASDQWNYGTGIGTGNGGTGGVITVNHGTVTAQGGIHAAAIGGAFSNKKDTYVIVINGGTVTATGSNWSGGIGSGAYANGGSITINGGVVKATGGYGGPGIGGGAAGYDLPGCDIAINGGSVEARGDRYSAGIGGGSGSLDKQPYQYNGGRAGTIAITGGEVRAYGGSMGGSGIGAGVPWNNSTDYKDGTEGSLSITGGTVTAVGGGSAGRDIYIDSIYLAGDTSAHLPSITAQEYTGALRLGTTFVDSANPGVGLSVQEIQSFTATKTIYPAVADQAAVMYLDADGLECWCSKYVSLSSVAGIGSGAVTIGTAGATTWYVADATIAAGGRITCAGDVRLILKDGVELKAAKGVTVQEPNSFTVYAQTDDSNAMGKLTVDGKSVEKNNSAIGGTANNAGASIVICGGGVTAVAPEGGGAGIGGGNKKGAGSCAIHGGSVIAKGTNGGAGIGGGGGSTGNGPGGSITITGGTVDATGQGNGAGIGGGWGSAGGTINISGGDVTAVGQAMAAGIGGGGHGDNRAGGDGGTIVISGGMVRASAQQSADYPNAGAAIGGGGSKSGTGGSAGSITIKGGEITATSAAGSGIGCGGTVSGSVGTGGTLALDWSDASSPANGLPRITCSGYGVSMVTYADANRAFAESAAPTTALSTDQVKALATQSTIFPVQGSVPYLDWNSATRSMDEKSCSDYVLLRSYLETAEVKTMGTGTTGSTARQVDYVELASGWYVVEGEIELDERLFVAGDVKLILKNGSRLLAKRGVNVDAGKTFTVYQQPEVEGESVGYLKAGSEGSDGCMYHSAAIGGYDASGVSSVHGGTVVINGGEIYARGGQHGAGIGGAANSGHGGAVTVNYGDVTAVAWNGGDGIGSAWSGAGSGIVTINGGKVTATGGGYGGGQSGAGISGTIVAIHGGEVKATGSSNDSTGAAGIGGRVATGSSVVIDGGKVVAKGGTNAAGIGAGSGGSASTVSLGWTRETFASTEVTASSYKGSVKFDRPYVWQDDDSTVAKWKSASDNNIDGVTIVPGVHFAHEVPLREGRWYDGATFAAATAPSPVTAVSLPVNSAFTARLDAAYMMGTAADLGFAGDAISDVKVAFTTMEDGEAVPYALPAGTTLTLSVVSDDGAGGTAYEHYYAVVEKVPVTSGGESALSLSEFASMKDRGVRFAPKASDEVYLVTADFKPTSVATTTAPVAMGFTASYVDSAGRTHTGAFISDEDSFSLVEIGSIEAGAASVNVTRAPAGSALLAGKRVFLVGEVSAPDDADGLNLQAAAATLGTGAGAVAGTWVSDGVVAFDLGEYGSVATGSRAFGLAGDSLAPGDYGVTWALYVDDAMSGAAPPDKTTWNVRDVLASNVATSTYTADGELPRLTAVGPTRSRLYSASEVGDAHPVSFSVTSNRSYTVAVEKQAALHDFRQVSVSGEKDAAVTAREESVVVPAAKGTYRVVFSMDGASVDDNVYYTVVVQ